MGAEWAAAEAALLRDALPPPAEGCAGEGGSGAATSFTFEFPGAAPDGTWNPEFAPLEAEAFLLEIAHAGGNRSWAARVSPGDSVYSFRGGFGEAMPPQALDGAPWVDTVLQWVGVDTEKNDPAGGHPWFVHQAGAYMREPDLMGRPFYSPTLAARCGGNECTVASWGQQAHVPTNFTSPVIFITRLRDCGGGVLEHVVALHNAVPPPGSGQPPARLRYFNVPWAAVRSGSLRDAFHGGGPGEREQAAGVVWPSSGLRHLNPIPAFGEDTPIPNVDATGGFTLFAEAVEALAPFPVPRSQGGAELSLVIAAGGCGPSPRHSESWGLPTVRCALEPTAEPAPASCRHCDFVLRAERPQGSAEVEVGPSVRVRGVLHWAYQGSALFFWPADGESTGGTPFAPGDVLRIERPPGKPWGENLALGFAHGEDSDRPPEARISRVRVGGTNPRRDAVVYTVNYMNEVAPGETLVKRSFLLSGPLQGMAEEAAVWGQQTLTRKLGESTLPSGSRAVHLFAPPTVGGTRASFGAGLGPGPQFCGGRAESVCEGSSAPGGGGAGARPLFSVTCGGGHYVGFDQYGLAPAPGEGGREGEVPSQRPWRCAAGAEAGRPEWKLLGWFVPDSCDLDGPGGLRSARLDVELCENLLPKEERGEGARSAERTGTSVGAGTASVAGPLACAAVVLLAGAGALVLWRRRGRRARAQQLLRMSAAGEAGRML